MSRSYVQLARMNIQNQNRTLQITCINIYGISINHQLNVGNIYDISFILHELYGPRASVPLTGLDGIGCHAS